MDEAFNPAPMAINTAAWVTGVIVGILIGWFAHKIFGKDKSD